MKKFRVFVKEVWVQTWDVEAENEAEAWEKALDGVGREGNFDYDCTLDDSEPEVICLDK